MQFQKNKKCARAYCWCVRAFRCPHATIQTSSLCNGTGLSRRVLDRPGVRTSSAVSRGTPVLDRGNTSKKRKISSQTGVERGGSDGSDAISQVCFGRSGCLVMRVGLAGSSLSALPQTPAFAKRSTAKRCFLKRTSRHWGCLRFLLRLCLQSG